MHVRACVHVRDEASQGDAGILLYVMTRRPCIWVQWHRVRVEGASDMAWCASQGRARARLAGC